MANIIHPLYPISGELQDLIFCYKDGKTHVRRKPVFPKNHFRQDNYKHSLQNAIQFGGASHTASRIHRQLKAALGDQLIPYAHNALAAAILKASKADRNRLNERYPKRKDERALPVYLGASTAKALLGLKLAQAHYGITPITRVITNPDGTKTYRITGLPDIAARMTKTLPKRVTRELRIRIVLVHTADIVREGETYRNFQAPDFLTQPAPSDWFDARLLTEIEPSPSGRDACQASMNRGGAHHLDIPAPDLSDLPTPQQGDHIVTYIALEWRDRIGRRTPTKLKTHTTLIPMEAIALHPEDKKTKQNRPPRQITRFRRARRILRKPVRPDLTPQQRLKAALSPIRRE